MTYQETIQDHVPDLGVDSEVENFSEEQASPDFSEFHKQVTVRYEPVPPGSSKVGDYERFEDHGNKQVKTVIKKRPQCPTCSYIPTEEEDPLHLPGECWKCNQPICLNCGVDCEACGQTMCPGHSTGYGGENESYCPECLEDVEAEVQFQRENEVRKQRRKDRKQRLKHQRELEKQARKLALSEREQLYDEQYDKKELKLQYWRAMFNHKENMLRAVTDEENEQPDEKRAGAQEAHQSRARFRTQEAASRRQLRRRDK